MKKVLLLAAIIGLTLGGCVRYQGPHDRDGHMYRHHHHAAKQVQKHHHHVQEVSEAVQPQVLTSYEQGYRDGCESGKWYDLSKIKKKDYHRAMNDPRYFHGWDEGFSLCRYNIYRERHSFD